MERLKRNFFPYHPSIVAPLLLGKYVVINSSSGRMITKVVEREACGGKNDLGCHVGRYRYKS